MKIKKHGVYQASPRSFLWEAQLVHGLDPRDSSPDSPPPPPPGGTNNAFYFKFTKGQFVVFFKEKRINPLPPWKQLVTPRNLTPKRVFVKAKDGGIKAMALASDRPHGSSRLHRV